jgi:hypothetical protein
VKQRHTTLGEFRRLTADLSDDVRILVPAPDHSYDRAQINVGTALFSDDGEITEDYGEEDTPEAQFGKRHNVLVIA